jgi:hypothetical protein
MALPLSLTEGEGQGEGDAEAPIEKALLPFGKRALKYRG